MVAKRLATSKNTTLSPKPRRANDRSDGVGFKGVEAGWDTMRLSVNDVNYVVVH